MKALKNDRTTTAGATTTGPVDWFANVVRTDTIMPVDDASGENGDPADGGDGSDGDRGAPSKLQSLANRLTRQYRQLPGWVLIPQIFLAFAWGRSGLAHLLDAEWWSGQGVLNFLATETGLRVDVYQHVLTGVIERIPVATAVAVVAIELLVAVLLLINYRAAVAIGVAIVFNLQLILAGAVNPAVFYLVVALGIGIWRVETFASPETVSRLSRWMLMAGVAVVAFLAPSVRTLRPEGALEDPALLLIFLTLLSVIALWWINRRMTLAQETLDRLTGDAATRTVDDRSTPSPLWLLAAAAGTALILFAGFGALTDEGRGQDIAAAADPIDAPGSFDTPYPFGLNVTMNYNDLTDGRNREWRVQVLAAVLEEASPIQFDPATDGQLAMARIRLTYQDGAAPTLASDIRFQAVGRSGEVFATKAAGCGSPEGRLPTDILDPGQAVEGWVCWPVPTDEVASLVMAVEAAPADGVLYMSLRAATEE
jgi:hypothetical protein